MNERNACGLTGRAHSEGKMGKFRKKPVVIEAKQFNGIPVVGMCFNPCPIARRLMDGGWVTMPHVHTIHADDTDPRGQAVIVERGDWILPEPDGEHFYPCKPDIFAATYEPVESAASTNVPLGKSAADTEVGT